MLPLQCVLTLAYVRIALRVSPARALREPRVAARQRDIDGVIRTFSTVAGKVPGTNCLHRALALRGLLARRGVTAVLRVGLQRRPNMTPGHAWLEVDGHIINDDPERVRRYVPLELTSEALTICYSR